jgi:hypothetical protein
LLQTLHALYIFMLQMPTHHKPKVRQLLEVHMFSL